MCNPLILAASSFAIGAAQTILSHQQDVQQASDQNRLYEQNRLNAIRAFEDQQNALNMRIAQEQEAAAAQKMETALEARAARATHKVAAGEAGVSGLSVEGLMRDFWSREARFNDRVDHQNDWTIAQLNADKKALGYTTLGRINDVPRARKPSFLGAGLKIASQGLNAAAFHNQLTRRAAEPSEAARSFKVSFAG